MKIQNLVLSFTMLATMAGAVPVWAAYDAQVQAAPSLVGKIVSTNPAKNEIFVRQDGTNEVIKINPFNPHVLQSLKRGDRVNITTSDNMVTPADYRTPATGEAS